jgi:alpha-L-fucosidase
MNHISRIATKGLLTSITAGLAFGPLLAPAAETGNANADRDARIAWWREGRFGMFIHWGLYAVPAGEWNGKSIDGIGEWIMNRAKIPVKDYEKLAGQFNPTRFDAEAWAQLAQDAGMKYLTITSKHHDGFAMFGSKVSGYNIVDATPFKRDPMKELSAACAKRGIKFSFYYSQSLDWHEPNGMGNEWDFGPDDKKDFDQYLQTKSLPQVREILTNYGPLGLIWFDVPKNMTSERAAKFENLVHELQPECLVSGRIGQGSHNDYDSTGDNRIPELPRAGDWETPATLNHTWGYKKDDHDWKTPGQLVFNLVDIVSKGGNYLLNVGPTAEGVIPQPSQDSLRGVGKWMKVNGEAIYGCGRTAFGDEYGEFDKSAKNPKFIAKPADWRCTTKPGKIYIHIFKWPSGKLELDGVKGRIVKAYLLADRGESLTVSQQGGRLGLELPAQAPDPLASVVCLEVAESSR